MSELVSVVAESSVLLSDSAFSSRGNAFADAEGDEFRIRIPVPDPFRKDPELISLFANFRKDWTELRHEIKGLRQRLPNTQQTEKASLVEEIRKLQSAGLAMERNFKQAFRQRLRHLRYQADRPSI